MGIYKGTQALSLNGANGADGTNGLNGGCTAIYYYNASINSVEGTKGANPGPNSVSGRYNVVGGLGATIDGGEGNFACGWGASVSGAQGNSAFGYNTQVTHASQGCHVEGYGNWLKASQGAHMEGYDNAAQGGLGCHIEGYGHGDVFNESFLALGAAEGIHVEGFQHTGIPSSGLKFGAHVGGMKIKPSSYLAGVTSGFFNGQNMELIGGQEDSTRPGNVGGLIRQMDEFGNMAIAGNFGCWINSQYEGPKFVTIQEIYDMIIALNPPV